MQTVFGNLLAFGGLGSVREPQISTKFILLATKREIGENMSEPKSAYAARAAAIFSEQEFVSEQRPVKTKLQYCECKPPPDVYENFVKQAFCCTRCDKIVWTQEEVEDVFSLTELKNKLLRGRNAK